MLTSELNVPDRCRLPSKSTKSPGLLASHSKCERRRQGHRGISHKCLRYVLLLLVSRATDSIMMLLSLSDTWDSWCMSCSMLKPFAETM